MTATVTLQPIRVDDVTATVTLCTGSLDGLLCTGSLDGLLCTGSLDGPLCTGSLDGLRVSHTKTRLPVVPGPEAIVQLHVRRTERFLATPKQLQLGQWS